MIGRTIVTVAVLAAAVAQEARPPLPLPGDPAPALSEDPRAPGPDRSGELVAPRDGRLDRDSFVADRFLAEAQRASYAFEARAGELSLFELTTYGYERGWQSAADIVVHGPDGAAVANARAEGGAAYRLFVPFSARADGEHRLELVASKQYFRYTLVRHSRFHAHDAGAAYALEQRTRVFDWLADSKDVVRYALDVAAGERVGFRILPSSEALRRQTRQARRAMLEGGAGDAPAMMDRASRDGAMSGMQGMRGGADGGWSPRIEATVGGKVLAAEGPYLWFVAEQAGSVEVRVLAGGRDGGIFELAIERDAPLVRVDGTISDGEGDPVSLAYVEFHRDPELDWMGTARSGADGRYTIELPAGEYTVLVSREDSSRPIVVRTAIEASRELNAIVGGGR